MTRGASRFEQDRTERVVALLRSAADFSTAERSAPDLAARAMAQWQERQSRSRSGRRAAVRLSCAVAALFATVGLATLRRDPNLSNARPAPRIVPQAPQDRRVAGLPTAPVPAQARRQMPERRQASAVSSTAPAVAGKRRPSFVPLAGGSAEERQRDLLSTPGPSRLDDLRSVNGEPAADRQASPLARDGWDPIEARVRREVTVRDDFVQILFPRLASTSERQIAHAVESYQREAAIVDTRLAREVTLQQKGMALADLCERLRSETGIQLAAGQSVADEKVTIFCKTLPLREVMRQLSRPFGYTWLRSGKAREYKYELVQDLRSQLLEEELRNRDRDAALIALDRQMQRYRQYLGLSPDEALARSRTAAPDEKKLLEELAGQAWGVAQLYFRLSPHDLAALRAGQSVTFSPAPTPGQRPLPPDVARGVLRRWREFRIVRGEDGRFQMGTAEGLRDGHPLAEMPDARPVVALTLTQNEVGQYTLAGGVGFTIGGDPSRPLAEWQSAADSFGGAGTFAVGDTGRGNFVTHLPLATATSASTESPRNAVVNARLARDPALRPRVTVSPEPSCMGDLSPSPSPKRGGVPEARGPWNTPHGHPSPDLGREQALPLPASGRGSGGEVNALKVTSADVLEALHRASGLPIVADYYTRLYPLREVALVNLPRFDALNRLADAMRMRWSKDGEWLQFRSVSYYHDRLKEVPNRLLSRWAASRRQHGALPLDDLLEIGLLSDAQLDAESMAEGARLCFGLTEWELARRKQLRAHARYLAGLSAAQRREALGVRGLAFTRLTLPQQRQFISLALAGDVDPQNVTLEDLSQGILRVEYTVPGGRQWLAPETGDGAPRFAPRASPPPSLSAAAIDAARRFDPQLDEAQLLIRAFPELNLRFTYTLGATPDRLMRRRVDVNGGGWHDPW
jgi:hypothetical protein